jgi:hypothetical protein
LEGNDSGQKESHVQLHLEEFKRFPPQNMLLSVNPILLNRPIDEENDAKI